MIHTSLDPNAIAKIDIIIPVYRNRDITRACVESVMASELPEGTSIIIIDDASPETEVSNYCQSLITNSHVTLLTHATNRGFVASVNEGMRLNPGHDIVLLNSDTQVAGNWLARLRNAAYSMSNVATVTPFSNNASICSFPNPNISNSLPAQYDIARLDKTFAQSNAKKTFEIPTAVGFCMFIRRAAIVDIGLFDEVSFGRGYGEENDFSLRAEEAGWKNLLAADVFVFHEGSVSFGDDRHQLMDTGSGILNERYPLYASQVHDFIKKDPLCEYRVAVLTEIYQKYFRDFEVGLKPKLLFITHHWGGGVQKHIDDLINVIRYRADVVVLRGMGKGRVELQLFHDGAMHKSWQFGDFDSNLNAWADAFRLLGFARVHLHHIHGWSPAILKLIQALGIPIDITLHDYWPVSPHFHLSPLTSEDQLSLVQEVGIDVRDGWVDEGRNWHKQFETLFNIADRVIAPSADVARRVGEFFPRSRIVYSPHPEIPIQIPGTTKVLLLGALSSAKGLDLVIRVAEEALKHNPNLQFRLLGHSAQPLPPTISVSGSYLSDELPLLLSLERPDVIWLPSLVHETFGYTLSAAIATGVPVVAADVGAFGERLKEANRATLLPANASVRQWLEALSLAVPHREAPSAYIGASFVDYEVFYTSPFDHLPLTQSSDAGELSALLAQAPAITGDPSKPILDLFRVGIYGGHRGAIEEVERRLRNLSPGSVDVIALEEFDALKLELVNQSEELVQTRDGLIQYQSTLSDTQRLLSNEIDAVRQYKEALEVEQRKSADLQDGLNQYRQGHETALIQLSELEEKYLSVLNSLSWKATRPFRVVYRVSANSARIGRRVWGLVKRPSSWSRILKIFRRGGVRAIYDRLGQELKNLNMPTPASVREMGFEQAILHGGAVQFEALKVPASEVPQLSIVIPVYGQHDTTYNCLASIAANPPGIPFEVIIADDASPESAEKALKMVSGVRIVRHAQNMGFLGNMNEGVKFAKGQWLVLLNNDTLVCRGAFDALIKTFSEHKNVGMVGAKLLNADGTVQEAGGIIWRDGSGWNWGRNQHRDDPRFNYVRDVDYCSGAVLALEKSTFIEMGGFDNYFSPAYYEDTDLAFRLREKGLRVLYQPAAEVYHLEGVSHGTDTNSGVKKWQQVNADKFYQRWQSVLLNHRENAESPEQEAHRNTRANVLVVEACMITPDQDSGSIRMLNLLDVLSKNGYHVSFVADNLEYNEKYVSMLQQRGVQVFHGDWGLCGVKHLIKSIGQSLDAVIVCRHYILNQYIDLLRVAAPGARIIFDTVDLHFVREEREAELHNSDAMLRAAATTKKQELSLIAKSDVTLVVSEYEQKLLGELLPDARVEIVSNIHNHEPERPDYSMREGIIFVGGFRHPPNIDAINWYIAEVMPHLSRLLPGVKTRIIGSNMPDSIRNLSIEGLEILGFIENIDPYLTGSRVSIAPLRYGAGVKGKINEAMNYGIPVVATACAVEGMHLEAGVEVLVADEATRFAEEIARVYHDEMLWGVLSKAGVDNVQRHFSPAAALPALERALNY